jgi:hypothetical protein
MKVIRDISLCLDFEENIKPGTMYGRDFEFQSRFIGNFLKRQLRLSAFEPKDFKRLLIYGCVNELNNNKTFNSFLCVSIPFNNVRYDSLAKDELPNFFIEMYKEGILKGQQTHELPVDFLFRELEKFKNTKYINEWEFKSKTLKKIGIKATLFCKMTMEAFTLSLVICKKKEVIYKKEILSTFPDETCYHYQFKDIVFENNKIMVTGWYGVPPIFELDLSYIAQ